MTNGNDISDHSERKRRPEEPLQAKVKRLHPQNQLILNAVWKGIVGMDGTCFPIEYSITPSIEDDVISGAVIAFRDITEQKRVEKALAERLARYKALAESTYAITWEFDIAADRWTYISPQAERILRRTAVF